LTVTAGGSGTVTSVAAASDWLTVSGSPITSSGTLTLNAPYTPQVGSANLTNWAGVATNLFATIGQLNLKQDASANLDSWSGTASNIWTTLGQFNDYTNRADWHFQLGSANLTNWSGVATNLFATLGQLNDFTNRADTAFQRGSSTLTNWSGTPTNAIPRAITNAGLAIGTLIYESNAPTFALKSISAGANVTLTDQVTNLVIASTGGGGGSNQTNFTNVIFYGGTGTTFNAIRLMSTNPAHSFGGVIGVEPDVEGVMNLKLGTLGGTDLSSAGTHVVIDRDGAILPATDLTKLGGVANTYFGQKRWDGRDIYGVQIGTANLTNWSGTSTSAIPRALTNAGASTGSLINDSNAPTWKLKSLSGSGVSVTDQGTNLLLAVPGPTFLDANGTQVAVINTASETVLYSLTVPGGSITNHRTVSVMVSGILSNYTGSGKSFILRVRLGGASSLAGTVVYQDTSASLISSSTPRAYTLNVDVSDDGTGTGQTVNGVLHYSTSAASTLGDGNIGANGSGPFVFASSSLKNFTGVNAGTNLLLEITVTPSAATNYYGIFKYIGRAILE
jgi:hypothetical protein